MLARIDKHSANVCFAVPWLFPHHHLTSLSRTFVLILCQLIAALSPSLSFLVVLKLQLQLQKTFTNASQCFAITLQSDEKHCVNVCLCA